MDTNNDEPSASTSKPAPRLSINHPPSQAHPPKASLNPKKKRSKSLGGPALERHILRTTNLNNAHQEALTLTFELTPRKKARRSLVPGKSILKSRPTVTGLERSTSDNNLISTLQHQSNPPQSIFPPSSSLDSSLLKPNRHPHSPRSLSLPLPLPPNPSNPISASQSNPNTRPSTSRDDPPHNDLRPADNSSDMDLSDDQGLLRTSLGSNTTTTLLRRVSFAAKAHVRTFGSPIVDPDSSTVSSTPSAPPPNESPNPLVDTNPSSGDSNPSEADQSADMSIDDSPSQHPPIDQSSLTSHQTQNSSIDHLNPKPSKIPSSRDQFNQRKASRLSMAIPGFGDYDDEDDDDDDNEQDSHDRPQSASTLQRSHHPQSLNPTPAPTQDSLSSLSKAVEKPNNPPSIQDDQELSQDMDLTNPFQSIPLNTIHTQPNKPANSSRPPNPVIQSGIPRLQLSTINEPSRRAVKSSRLSVALPEHLRGNLLDETKNLGASDIPPLNPSSAPATSAESNPVANSQSVVSQESRPNRKTSRLSVALPEYMRGNSTDDTQDLQIPDTQSAFALNPSAPSAPQTSVGNSSSTDQTGVKVQTANTTTFKSKPSKSSRLTNFLGFSNDDMEDEDDPPSDSSNNSHLAGKSSQRSAEPPKLTSRQSSHLSSSNQFRPMELDHNVGTQDSTHDPIQVNKSSRLTELFSNSGDSSRESNLALDSNPGLSHPSHNSEPLARDRKSRISEFLSLDDSSETGEGNIALIDFNDSPTNGNSPSPQDARFPTSTSFFHHDRENENLMITSMEYSSHHRPSSTTESLLLNPQSAGPAASTSTSSQSIVRAGSLPRPSIEKEFPRLSLIRTLPQFSSASPSRRLSASQSGSPRKLAPTIASPRRSNVSIGSGSNNSTSINPSEDIATHTGSLPRLSASRRSSSIGTKELTSNDPSRKSNIPQTETNSIASSSDHPIPTSSIPPPQPQPPTPPAVSINLNEFFEQAEIRFISLSQPRVRNHDQQNPAEDHTRMSNFSQQIFAGMVKIPRLRLLESSSRILRQKTEILDFSIKEHENEVQKNGREYKVLKDWLELRSKGLEELNHLKLQPQASSSVHQRYQEELNEMMNQLRLKKNLVETLAKRDSLQFDIEIWSTYHSNLSQRISKLNQDLEVMREMGTKVKPSTEWLRDRKRSLSDEIRRRKLKIKEIESCDQDLLKALKDEAKDLTAVTESNRRTLVESEFERKLWLDKFIELEEEKKDHLLRIQNLKSDPNPSQNLTVHELIRLKNEFTCLQSLMGWEMIRFEEDLMEFKFSRMIGVKFDLGPISNSDSIDENNNNVHDMNSSHSYRNAKKIELEWLNFDRPPPNLNVNHLDLEDLQLSTVLLFFFSHLKSFYQSKKLHGRVKEFVEQISSIWNLARGLAEEIKEIRGRFRVKIEVIEEPMRNRNASSLSSKKDNGNSNNSRMKVTIMIRSIQTSRSVDVNLEFSGEEILDPKANSALMHLSSNVTNSYSSSDKDRFVECPNLSYTLTEHIEREEGQRGSLKRACLEILSLI